MSDTRAPADPVAALHDDYTPKAVQLIRAAYRVMGDEGMHNISIQDVADVAGVSKGVVLYHFKTKENLILATMRWALSRTAVRINEGLDGASTPREQVVAMVDAIFVRADANRGFYVIYLDLVDYAARSANFGHLSATFQEIVNGLYADLIAQGVAAGDFRVEDPVEAAKVVRAIIDGLFVQWMQEDDWQALHPRYKAVCTRALLSYLEG